MADLTIKAVIEILLRGKGADEAAKILKEIEQEAKRLATGLDRTSDSSAQFGEKLRAALGPEAAEALKKIRDHVKNLAEQEEAAASSAAEMATRLQAALAPPIVSSAEAVEKAIGSAQGAINRLGQDADAAEPLVRSVAVSLEEQGKALQTQTIPAFERFLGITENVPTALAATKVAADLSRQGLISYEDAVEGLAQLMQDNIPEAATALGVSLTKASGHVKTNAELLVELKARYGDIAAVFERARTNVDNLARAHAEVAQRQKEAAKASAEFTDKLAPAVAPVKAMGPAATAAAGGLTTLGTAIKGLLVSLGIVFGIAQAFQFLKRAIVGAADEERAINALRIQINALGIEGGPSLELIRDRLLEIEREGGPALLSTLPAFQKLIGITKDTAAALELAALAARVHESGMLDVGSAAEALANILQGRAALAAKTLGVRFEEGASRAKVLQAVFDQFPARIGKIEDTRNAIDRLTGAVTAAGRQFAERFGPTIETIIRGFTRFTNGLRGAGEVALDVAKTIIQSFATVGETLLRVLNFGELLASPQKYLENLLSTIAEGGKKIENIWSDHLKRQEEIFGQAGERAGEAEAEGRRKALADAEARDEKDRIARARKTEIAALEARLSVAEEGSAEQIELQRRILGLQRQIAIDEAETTGEAKADIEARFRSEEAAATIAHERKLAEIRRASQELILQSMVAASVEGTQQRLDAELKLLDFQRKAEEEKVKSNAEAVAAIRAAFAQQAATKQKEFDEDRRRQAAQAEQDILRARIAAADEGSQLRFDLEMRLLDRETAERIRRAQEAEEDITAIQLAAALGRMERLHAFEEQQLERRLQQVSDLQGAEADVERAELEAKLAIAREGTSQFFAVTKELIAIEAAEQIKAIEEEERRELARLESKRQLAEAEIELVRQTELAKLLARSASNDQIDEIERELQEQKARAAEETDESTEAVQAQSAAKILAVKQRTTTAEIQMDKAAKLAKEQMALQAASTIIGALTTIFGKSKAFAVAEAVISTWQAAALANATYPWPYSAVVMAIVAAAGLAQVRKILSTNIGSSGGGASAEGSAGGGQAAPSSIQRQPAAAFAAGGPVATASHGDSGLLKGPGTPTSDSIAALTKDGKPVQLSTEEYVVKGRAVKRRGILRLLDLINREKLPEPAVVADSMPEPAPRAAMAPGAPTRREIPGEGRRRGVGIFPTGLPIRRAAGGPLDEQQRRLLSVPTVELARRLQGQIGVQGAAAATGEATRQARSGQAGGTDAPAPVVNNNYDQHVEEHYHVSTLINTRADWREAHRRLQQAAIEDGAKRIR